MTEYIVLIPDNETTWAALDEAERQRVYGKHRDFAAALAERGHKMTGGAELAPASQSRVVRRDGAGALAVTEGPYAEAVEQLSGFYLIETDDLDGLLDTVGILAEGEGALEVRECLSGSGD
jgi:hypothetical protein